MITVENIKSGVEVKCTGHGVMFADSGKSYSGKREHARSTAHITCGCCGTEHEVFIWSLAGGGKKCDHCGCVMSSFGKTFINPVSMTKKNMIEFIKRLPIPEFKSCTIAHQYIAGGEKWSETLLGGDKKSELIVLIHEVATALKKFELA